MVHEDYYCIIFFELNLEKLTNFNYNLTTLFSDINLPEQLKNKVEKGMAGKSSFNLENDSALPLIKVNTTFSPVTVNIK